MLVNRTAALQLARGSTVAGYPQELHFHVKAPHDEYDHMTVILLHHGQATMRFDKAQLAAFDD